jgi:hypothetical protein
MLLKNYSGLSLIRILPVYLSLILAETVFFVAVRKAHLAKADLRAIGWNIKHLSNTLSERKKVQKARRVSDSAIIVLMNPHSIKLEYFKWFMSNKQDPAWVAYFTTK